MDNLCTVCINSKHVIKEQELKSARCDDNCKKGSLENCLQCSKKLKDQNPQYKKKIDDQIKICQRSISFIHNQQIYMKQFIDHQINELILLLQERLITLQNNLTDNLQKKLDFYTDCELKLNIIKKNQDYNKLKQLPFSQLEPYEDDKIMDFSNIKILTEEIKNFGKRITNKKVNNQLTVTKKVVQDNKENFQIKEIQEKKEEQIYYSFLPKLDDCILVYKLGQKFQLLKQRRIIGFIFTNTSKFGWYYDCEIPTSGYNICKECYIFSLDNSKQIPPMKFYPKDDQIKYSLYLTHSKIGFGKDCKDLLIDFDNIKNSSSCLGQSYDLIPEIDGETILAGRQNNWNIEMIEIFYFK